MTNARGSAPSAASSTTSKSRKTPASNSSRNAKADADGEPAAPTTKKPARGAAKKQVMISSETSSSVTNSNTGDPTQYTLDAVAPSAARGARGSLRSNDESSLKENDSFRSVSAAAYLVPRLDQ
ncbi:hypothetical protein CPC08DRAFT_769233 [Agrocybe pediades]|nr:hypothetical protein CPC08DRAFT_769233 [Agrocybe pediades]